MQEVLDKEYNIYVVYKSTSSQTSTLVDDVSSDEVNISNDKNVGHFGGQELEEEIFYLRLSVQIYLEAKDFEALEYLVPTLLLASK